ncbi:MAG: Rhomboid protease GluP [Bacteroidota bacterium]|jgi:rhomboid protease GluP
MAFGFSPQYAQDYQLEGLDREHFLAIAIEAIDRLELKLSKVTSSGILVYTKMSAFSWSEEITLTFGIDKVTVRSQCTGNQLFDWGKNRRNVQDLILEIKHVRRILKEEKLAAKLQALSEIETLLEELPLSAPASSAKDKISHFFSIFKITEGYRITPILVNLNLVVFVVMLFAGVSWISPSADELVRWGANYREFTLAGQGWRLLTACFLHAGIFHLLFNMYALVYIGLLLEPHIGSLRFLLVYLLAGIGGSMASLWWNDYMVAVGASGAIFGLYGVFLALLLSKVLDKNVQRAFLTSTLVFVIYMVLNSFKKESNIDNAAHFGGFFTGFMFGFALIPSLKKPKNNFLNASILSLFCVILLTVCVGVYNSIPNEIAKYSHFMKRFAVIEKAALKVYRLPKNSTKLTIFNEVNLHGLPKWNRMLALVQQQYKLELPQQLLHRNRIIENYCKARIKSFELIRTALLHPENNYNYEVNYYNQYIMSLLEEMQDLQQQ